MEHGPGEALAPSRVIWLDEAVLADVRSLLTSTLGTVGPAFALVDLDDGGLRGAAVDATTGQCLIELNDNTLNSASFDRAIADHLVRTGKTAMPTTAEWARELVGMMSQARVLLGTSEATFVMGKRDVGLLRVTKADVEEALSLSVVRAISVARSVSLASPGPICAVVVMSHHIEWPGLLEEMSRAFDGQLPVLPLRTSPAPVRGGRHSRTEPVPIPVPAAADRLPDPLPEPFPGPSPTPAPAPDARSADRRRQQNRLVMGAAAVIAGVIVAGGITAAVGPWRDDTGALESQRYLTAPTTSGTPTAPATPAPSTTITTTIPPINTAAALDPIVVYTAPPPPPPPTRRTTQRPRQNPLPNPLPNTIPNPIPGQPPIVLP